MDLTRVLVGADLRRRWRSWALVALLAGVTAGVAMAAIAGGGRTSSAMDRFVDHFRPANAYAEGVLTEEDLEAIDGVEAVNGGDYFLLVPVDAAGRAHPEDLGAVSPFSHTSSEMFRTFNRPLLVEGELPDPDDPTHVAVDEEMAARYDLGAGSPLQMQAYDMDQVEDLFEQLGRLAPTGDVYDFVVTGVTRAPQDVVPKQQVPDVVYLGSAEVNLGGAFDRAHRRVDIPSLGAIFGDLGPVGTEGFEVRIDLERTTPEAFEEAVLAIDGDAAVDLGGGDADRAAQEGERSIRLQSMLVLAFGLLVAVGGVVLVGQALRRQLETDRALQRTVQSLGVTGRAATGIAAAKGAVVAAASAVVAVVVSVALSPLTPVGDARRAEVSPGVDVDLAVLAGGVVALALLLVGVPAWTAHREAGAARRATSNPATRTTVADRAARAGFSPPVVAGIRFAGLGAGRNPVLLTVFFAAIGIVGSLGFAASEGRLASDRQLWGWSFDVVVGDGNTPDNAERAEETLADNPDVEAYALSYGVDAVRIDGPAATAETRLAAIEDVRGRTDVRMLDGLAPQAEGEVALGGATARRLGVGIGDEVEIAGPDGPAPLEVTGLVVMNLGLDTDRIGEGALVAPDTLRAFDEELAPTFVLVTFADDVSMADGYATLREEWGDTVLRPLRPIDVDNLHGVRFLPVWFSVVVAAIAVATLVFALVVTIRRRRRDLALLRTIGFDGRDLRRTVLVHAMCLLLPGLLLGAVAGLIVGRLVWSFTARSLGAPEVHELPIAAVAAVTVGGLLVGWAAAAVPGRRVARDRPALVLRAE